MVDACRNILMTTAAAALSISLVKGASCIRNAYSNINNGTQVDIALNSPECSVSVPGTALHEH
jgi:hypothetical protein